MRRFWHPIAAVAELEGWPTQKVRLLGEDLALFKTEAGTYALVADRCPHRGASLSCGMIEGDAIRCAYHGWKFDRTGQCLDTPAEPPQSTLRNRITIAGYPVQPMAGLLWAYLGPQPAPLLPRYEHMVRDGWTHDVGISRMPCNWLQIAENTLDPLHIEYLHMKYTNWARKQKGLSEVGVRHHVRVGFEVFEYGIIKRRLWEGEY